jgi:O-antigen/teichoic acid export membrane protein
MIDPRRLLARISADRVLLRSSAIVFAGESTARLLGFLFSVAAARLLTQNGFGQIAYALAAVAIVTVLTNNAPQGLGRFLARHHDDPATQATYTTNWLIVIGLMLTTSLVLVIPAASWAGLGGALTVGLIANLLGTVAFQTYREAQKGFRRFWATSFFWILANSLQLVAIVIAAMLGFRSPALFLTIYGLSSVVALALMSIKAPAALRFSRRLVAWRQVRAIARFVWPVILTGVFYTVWLGADLILLHHLLPKAPIGNYAAARTLILGLSLPLSAINFALGPRMARMAESAVRPYILNLVLLAAAIVVPLSAGAILLGQPLLALTFGERYAVGSQVLFVILVLGQACFALCGVLQAVWIWGLSRPGIDPVSTGSGMVVTIALGLALIPHAGLTGAALAYAAGAATQLLVLVVFTGWAIYAGARPRLGPVRELILELDQVAKA